MGVKTSLPSFYNPENEAQKILHKYTTVNKNAWKQDNVKLSFPVFYNNHNFYVLDGIKKNKYSSVTIESLQPIHKLYLGKVPVIDFNKTVNRKISIPKKD
jgi:hypothetical protein